MSTSIHKRAGTKTLNKQIGRTNGFRQSIWSLESYRQFIKYATEPRLFRKRNRFSVPIEFQSFLKKTLVIITERLQSTIKIKYRSKNGIGFESRAVLIRVSKLKCGRPSGSFEYKWFRGEHFRFRPSFPSNSLESVWSSRVIYGEIFLFIVRPKGVSFDSIILREGRMSVAILNCLRRYKSWTFFIVI